MSAANPETDRAVVLCSPFGSCFLVSGFGTSCISSVSRRASCVAMRQARSERRPSIPPLNRTQVVLRTAAVGAKGNSSTKTRTAVFLET